jgi:leucyl aminopeptidase
MKLSFKKNIKDVSKVDANIFVLTPSDTKALLAGDSQKISSIDDFLKSHGVKATKGFLTPDFEGKFLQIVSKDLLIDGKHTQHVIFVGWDKDPEGAFDKIARYRKFGATLKSIAEKKGFQSISINGDSLDWSVGEHHDAFLEGLLLSSYSYTRYKSKAPKNKTWLKSVSIVAEKVGKGLGAGLGESFCEATFLARDLVNTPPIDCPPAELVKTAKVIARKQRLGIDVYNRNALKKMGAGGILGVSMASANEPYLIRLKYKGKSAKAPKIALIGKGITFDSGGLSIKTGQGMETMKCDMAGAAAVLGAMSVIKDLSPKSHVTAYVPTCENMVSANALRPGDVIKHMNGKTVEVLNTDAEGRLILADAMTLAVKDGADIIIDLATLTGACVVALGNDYAGIFSTDEALTKEIIHAGELSGERYWPMPLAQEYVSQLKSPVADLKNIGSRSGGGAITAALFLQQFIGETKKWAHLDIAGPAFREGEIDHLKAGGVGFGVRTLLRFLSNH